MATEKKKTESTGLYTAGLVLGIIGVVFAFIPLCYWIAYILGILALVFGIIGLVKKAEGHKALAATILGAVALVVGIVMNVIAVKTAEKIIDSWGDEVTNTVNTFLENYDDDVLDTKVKVTLGEYQDAKDDTWSDKALPVTVTNISDETLSFSVSVEALDANGDRLDEDTVYASNLAPGQSYTEETFDWSSVDEDVLEQATFRVYRANSY